MIGEATADISKSQRLALPFEQVSSNACMRVASASIQGAIDTGVIADRNLVHSHCAAQIRDGLDSG
jgi:hypothetical protein